MDYIGELRKLIGTRPIIMCGANVILINENEEILLHHRTDNDWWGLPGGAMELGESMEETAFREVNEEVNLRCHKLELFNVYSGKKQYHVYPDGNEVFNVTVTYLCKHFSGKIVVEETEGRDACFYNINNLPQNLCKPIIPIINDYIEKTK